MSDKKQESKEVQISAPKEITLKITLGRRDRKSGKMHYHLEGSKVEISLIGAKLAERLLAEGKAV